MLPAIAHANFSPDIAYTSAMNRLLHTALSLIWGVWFGSLVMLFVGVQAIFRDFKGSPDFAATAATAIFHSYNRLRLYGAAVAVLLTFIWYIRDRTYAKMAVFTLLALAVVAAVYSSGILTPQIDHLRIAGDTHSPEFRRLHGLSMIVYLAETVLVFVVGIMLPSLRERTEREHVSREGTPAVQQESLAAFVTHAPGQPTGTTPTSELTIGTAP